MAMHTQRTFFFIFFTLFLIFFLKPCACIDFEFPYFTTTINNNLTLVGDSYLRNGVVSLTTPTVATATSTGAIFYANPISLFDPYSNTTSSFSTTFSFSITNTLNPTSFGDGLAFFLTPTNPSTAATPTTFIAVEFDTKLHNRFNDPNENHVGLDIDALISLKTANPISHGIDLKSGNPITAWVDYSATDPTVVDVFLSYSSVSKPFDPVLRVTVDLSEHLKDPMYIGFSASSSDGSSELHLVENWSFRSFGFVPVRPSSRAPHNVSDSTVGLTVAGEGAKKQGNRKQGKNRVGVGFAVAGPVFFCAVFSFLGYLSVRKWKKGVKKVTITNLKKPGPSPFVACPREYDYKELKSATREFHPSRIVGHGSFGTVYKAFLISSGTIAAVKRSRHSHEGKTEFLAELSIIAGLRHKNLVQLQGWCAEKGELLLVYDFMANGSLDKVLYKEPERGKVLSWGHRVNIALGLASVLVYLHQECEQRVIHRDIKTGNVLLDGNFNPRLGDFGLAKLMDHDKSPVSTLTAGTMGYLAPEYLQYGKANDKTDVFSYGVVVLEVACGKRPIEREGGAKMVNLVDWVWGLHYEGRILEAADKRLNGEFDEEGMRMMLLLGLSCANPDSAMRPSMRRVLQILSNEAEPFKVPKVKPSLSFSSDLPLSIDELVSDAEEFNTNYQSMCEIKIS
ncbi:probable L-type lectin-domain containing receptor kinase S.7 [Lotus japonicus]|uniref:probable L-type lectin-domain containing receptor kinase S.7 n=1 Tax=Lotus japonicus TaxID=34305 RepID=UPI00258EA3D5|nr:probable L-type lectin-domain containing receptor kinase S.7 [Lotus japonicus]